MTASGNIGSGVRCAVQGYKGGSIFEAGVGVHGNVDEGRSYQHEGAIKMETNKHSSRKTRLIDVKHHLLRDTCNARKIQVICVRLDDQHVNVQRLGCNRIA